MRQLQHAHGLIQGDPSAPANPSLRAAVAAVAATARSLLVAQLGPHHRLRMDLALAQLQLAATLRDDAAVVQASFQVLDHVLHGHSADAGTAAAGECGSA